MNINLHFENEMWSANNKKGETLKTSTSYEGISDWAKRNKHTVVTTTGIDIESVEDLIRATDFGDLRKQKQILMKVAMGDKLTTRETNELNGLVNFIDSFQDMCVDVYEVPNKQVFPNVYK